MQCSYISVTVVNNLDHYIAMGTTVYLCAFVVAILVVADRVRTLHILEEVKNISNDQDQWVKVGNQVIVDPERELEKPEALKEMLKYDLAAIEDLIKKIYKKVKTAIMCRSYRFFMPIVKMGNYVVVTVTVNRDDAENAVREAALEAAQKAPTTITDTAAESVTKYIKLDTHANDFGVFADSDDPDVKAAHGAAIVESALLSAQETVRQSAFEKDVKIVSDKAASEKANAVIKDTKFRKELLDKELVRKTADEKNEIRNRFKKVVPVEETTSNEDDDIEKMLNSFNNAPSANEAEELNRKEMIERVASRSALKTRKKAIRSLVDSVKESIITAIDNMESWLFEGDAGFEFINQMKEKINNTGKSKVELSNLLNADLKVMLNSYKENCDHNYDVSTIYAEFNNQTKAILDNDGEYSVDNLMTTITELNNELKLELDSLPVAWKTIKTISIFPTS